MAEIVDLNQKRVENSPHASGECRCMACKHEWIAVYSLPIEADLECPDCGLERGIPLFNHAPEIAYTCNCGSIYFVISPDNAICIQCASLTPLEDL